MKKKNKKQFNRFTSFIMCFFILLEALFSYSSITANATSITDTYSDDSSTNLLDTTNTVYTPTIFPDEKFLSYVMNNFDTNQDNELSEEEIAAVTKIDVNNLGITSLEGLELFTNLEELNCRNNLLTTINLSTLLKLSILDCSFNQLTYLDLSNNTALTNLTCLGNARAVKLDDKNGLDLSTLENFDITPTKEWSTEYTQEENTLYFPDFTGTLVVTYITNAIETSLEEPVVFSLLLYKEDFADVTIDEATFPDSALREMLLSNYDKNEDQILNNEELSQLTSIDISTYDIGDLTGLSSLTALVTLNYSKVQSLELDLSIVSSNIIQYCDNTPVTIDSAESSEAKVGETSESVVEEATSLDETAILEETTIETTDNSSVTDTDTTINDSETDSDTIVSTQENTVLPSTEADTLSIDVNPANAKKRVYNIEYQLDGGTNPEDVATTFQTGDTVNLASPYKKGYQFNGWYLDIGFTTPISVISADTATNITVYAKWTQLLVDSSTSISKLKTSGKGKISVTYNSLNGVNGYEILCSTAKNFKSNLRTTTTSKTSITVKSLIKNKTYYVKVRGYILDSAGEKVYGPYSSVKKVKVKSGIAEAKATSSSAKISSTKITDSSTVTVKAKTSNIVKSNDSYYYLFGVPSTQSTIKNLKPVAKAEKSTSVTFTTPLDINGKNNLLQSKFVVAVKQKSGYQIISSFTYISNPEGAATYTYAFPTTPTKKGLQGYSSSLGINHTVLNIEVNDLIATKSEYSLSSTDQYSYKGKTYYFRRDVANQYAYTAKEYEKNGTVVYAILLLGWSSKTILIAPGARDTGYAYYAWNTKDKSVKEQLEATVTYFAEYCAKVSKTGPGIAGWIVGNEVDNFDTWNYAGTSNIDAYTKIYADTFRLVYNATKSVYANARVYVSLDHMWGMSNEGSYGSKAFLEKFNSILKSEGNIDWDIAFHPYPVPLTDADFWNNDFLSNNENSPIVNMKNLSVMTNYVTKQYGKDKRIILSEVGFTSQSGEKVQAAAIAYAYYVAEFNSSVDAIIMRSLEDAQVEVDQGLSFGIKGKYAYNVYKYMDTPKSEQYTKFALNVIKAKSWKSIVPKYNAKKFKSMPSR